MVRRQRFVVEFDANTHALRQRRIAVEDDHAIHHGSFEFHDGALNGNAAPQAAKRSRQINRMG